MLAIFGLWFGVVTLAAQDLFTLKVDVRVVSVDVTVTDSQSALVNTLTKDDFQIYEDGILQAIEFFSSVSAPNNILLLFDRSESTRGNRAFMQDVIGKLLGTMRDQDSFAWHRSTRSSN